MAASSSADTKLADMTAKMAAREADIRRRLEELRVARADGKSEAEHYTAFEAAFEAERLAIVAELDELDAEASTTTKKAAGAAGLVVELNKRLGSANERIACLQRYHSDSVAFLPVYVSASAKAKVEELTARLTTVRDHLLPKKRFAFSSSASATSAAARTSRAPTREPPQPEQQQQPQPPESVKPQQQQQPALHNQTNATVALDADSLAAKDVLLCNLTGCTVRLFGHPATLHLHDLDGCTLMCGPVHSSAFIERCSNCTLLVACHQLRLHSSSNCVLYLHATSTPIIEDCAGIRVAPYALRYPSLDDHVTASGLNWTKNQWDRVQDFNHLAGHVASPNWSVLPEAERRNWDEA